jgi:hypothetical protein
VSRAEERELARGLAAVLDRRAPAAGEAGELARLLEAAAGTARAEVTDAETEAALATARPRARRRSPALRAGLAAGIAAAALAAVLVLVVLSPFTSAPGLDVAAEARAALGGNGAVLRVVEVIARAGDARAATRSGWLDPSSGRARWKVFVGGRLVEDTLVTRSGVRRYLPLEHVVVVGATCGSLASACADLVDPVAFYRAALVATPEVDAEKVELGGRAAYRFVLPARRLAGSVRIEQLVWVDAETFAPRRIVWRDVRDRPEPVSVVAVRRLAAVAAARVPEGTFRLDVPPTTRVEERSPEPVLFEVGVPLAEARAIRPPLTALDPARYGEPSVSEAHLASGRAYVVRYDGLAVWNYRGAVPPAVTAVRDAPVKSIPVGDGTATVYFGERGVLVAELERPGWSVAVVSQAGGKGDVLRALESLRELR